MTIADIYAPCAVVNHTAFLRNVVVALERASVMPTTPYLYGPQSSYSIVDPFKVDFDPKAYTRSTWQTPSPSYSRPAEPILNFNRHPDSYVAAPYGNTNAKEMPANTNKKVKLLRGGQLSLRVLELLGALGLLVCAICVKIPQTVPSYVVRITVSRCRLSCIAQYANVDQPAVDILTTAYAIYHLARAAKSRPPASSASYHFFALVIDIALVPFFVFIILASRNVYGIPFNGDSTGGSSTESGPIKWGSLFSETGTETIIQVTYLVSIINGGLHLVSALISLYLVYLFNKISHLPPDMNPLENNLTSRKVRKHRYKNSELSTSTISQPQMIDKVSLYDSARGSMIKETAISDTRPISFLHTRSNSDQVYSPHNPATAAASRSNLALPGIPQMYHQPQSARHSRMNLSQSGSQMNAQSLSPTKYSHNFMSEPSSRTPTMTATVSKAGSTYTSATAATRSTNPTAPAVPRKSSKRHSNGFPSDNWFVHESDGEESDGDLGNRSQLHDNTEPAISIVDEDEYDPYRSHDLMPSNNSVRGIDFGVLRNPAAAAKPKYASVPQMSASPQSSPPRRYNDEMPLNPLGMNPPTPEPTVAQFNSPRPLSAISGNTTPKKSVGTPAKTRYYGDLSSAMAGVRGQSPSPGAINRWGNKLAPEKGVGGNSGAEPKSQNSGFPERKDWAVQDGGRQGRVVSRTGADEGWEQSMVKDGLRGRHVSGKIAEEGRGGARWGGWSHGG